MLESLKRDMSDLCYKEHGHDEYRCKKHLRKGSVTWELTQLFRQRFG